MESGINGLEFKDESQKTTTSNTYPTPWADFIKIVAHILLVVNFIGGFILFAILADSYATRDFAWVAIFGGLTYVVLYYPLIMGFSKIVEAAETYLRK